MDRIAPNDTALYNMTLSDINLAVGRGRLLESELETIRNHGKRSAWRGLRSIGLHVLCVARLKPIPSPSAWQVAAL